MLTFLKGTKFMLKTIITVLQLVSAVVLTVVVLSQSGKTAGISGAIAGGADTFLSKNKARTLDAKLAKATKYIAIAFILLTLFLNMVV
ncbi:MAG: preprotein translocase subunit SecG [Oscillospiraceae bacterium]|nr:preprotein translocase subunit SecG [Oscillospiraceae bacterium]